MSRFLRPILAASFAASLVALPSAPSDAARRSGAFDGQWSVVIYTTYGDCDRSLRYSLQIIGGLSYGWYLWHWPFILLAVAYFDHDKRYIRLGAALAALLVATAAYTLVENRVRFAKALTRSSAKRRRARLSCRSKLRKFANASTCSPRAIVHRPSCPVPRPEFPLRSIGCAKNAAWIAPAPSKPSNTSSPAAPFSGPFPRNKPSSPSDFSTKAGECSS